MDLLVAFWNLENLFAPENFPDREPWIAEAVASDLRGWTQALFNRKIAQLASIITQLKANAGPDLLGVCEVENAFVLKALSDQLNALLPARDYQVVHFNSTRDRRGIDTAFVYDHATLATNPNELFSHWVMRRTGTRDITQATFITGAGNELVALANHWPSRSAPRGFGSEYSSGFRRTAGETLGYWHERIREEKGENVSVIAMGDFNDDPFDASLMIHAVALRERGDVLRAQSAKFYNFAWTYLTRPAIDHRGNPRELDGTLYYAGDGNVFDQLLVSGTLLSGKGPLSLVEGSAGIEAFPEMVDHRVSEGPIRFRLPKGDPQKNVNMDGFSDHFPVSLMLRETASG